MSIYNSQEYSDGWDEMSSSLQEQLLQDVAQLESTGTLISSTKPDQALSLQDTRHSKKQKRYHDEQGQFRVYKDPLLTAAPTSRLDHNNPPKSKSQLLDRTNQQHLQHYDPIGFLGTTKSCKKKEQGQPSSTHHQPESVPISNDDNLDIIDDDDMWLEFDDMDIPALLDDMENNSSKGTTTATLHDQIPDDNGDDDETLITLEQLDNTLQKFGGFQMAGSRKEIKLKGDSLKAAHDKALALMAEPLTLTSTPAAPAPVPTSSPTSNSPIAANPLTLSPQSSGMTANQDRHHSPTFNDMTPTFTSGFSTARGTKLNEPSLESRRKAQQLLLASPTQPSSSPPHATTGIDPEHPLVDTPNMTTTGFTTADGTKLDKPSLDATKKAQQLLQTSPTLAASSADTLNRDSLQHSTALTEFGNSTYQYEDVLQQYGGFSKASGKKTDTIISEAAKQQALALFTSDTSSTQLTLPSQSSQGQSPVTGSSQQVIDQDETITNSTSILSSTATLEDTSPLASITSVSSSPSLSSIGQDQDTITSESSSILQQTKAASDNSSPSLSVSPSPPTGSATEIVKPASALKRRIHNQKDKQRPRSKPFKSPAVNLDLVKAGLEKRVSTTASVRMKGPSVFNMHQIYLLAIGCRRPLSSLGKPHRYTKETLLSMKIPEDIIDLTPCLARSYIFENNWGVQDAEKELLAAGALSTMLPEGWIENHYGWIVWKLARRLCMLPQYAKADNGDDDTGLWWWSPEYVLNQLLYRYEREINLGKRSVLRRIMEQDDVPVKQMVLMVADIVCISSSSKMGQSSNTNGNSNSGSNNINNNKYRLQLTDGWYQISTFVDSKMDNMIFQGRIYIGQKLTITGAQLSGDCTPKTPLEGLTMAKSSCNTSQHHDITNTTLIISSNSCLPCSWDATLGYPRRRLRRHVIRRLDTNIYENGGLITMMEVVICKKYPMMYSETLENGMTVKRNSRDEEDYRRILDLQQHQHLWSSSSTSLSPDNSKSQDRRVSGHFRLRLCDANNSTLAGQHRPIVVGTLLVTNTSEIMHMDLVEGQHYRLFFIQPYQPRNKPLEGPNLITTRLTKWEPLSPSKQQQHVNNEPTYPLRFICRCADIKDLTMTDVDMAVLVIHTQPHTTQQSIDGRKAWYSTLLVTDSSLTLCQITYRSFYRPAQDMNGQILGLMNVRFELYDSKCDIIHIKSSSESEVWTNPFGAMGFMQLGMKELKQWSESEPSGLTSIQQRVKDLIQ
ncbi:hypothetical protein BC941DRAFT_437299 [Chlamydoabsidia padenii]|nr:hypothetical protein BC941DRAFT_437299 [Chlamydoabsidia padenii]